MSYFRYVDISQELTYLKMTEISYILADIWDILGYLDLFSDISGVQPLRWIPSPASPVRPTKWCWMRHVVSRLRSARLPVAARARRRASDVWVAISSPSQVIQGTLDLGEKCNLVWKVCTELSGKYSAPHDVIFSLTIEIAKLETSPAWVSRLWSLKEGAHNLQQLYRRLIPDEGWRRRHAMYDPSLPRPCCATQISDTVTPERSDGSARFIFAPKQSVTPLIRSSAPYYYVMSVHMHNIPANCCYVPKRVLNPPLPSPIRVRFSAGLLNKPSRRCMSPPPARMMIFTSLQRSIYAL